MVNKVSEVGDPNGSYYELKRQTGGDTPLSQRLLGIYYNNPYSSERKGLVDVFPMTHFHAPDGSSYQLSAAQRRARYWYTATSSVGSPPAISSIYSELDQEWKNTDLNIGMYLSPEGRESVGMVTESVIRMSTAANRLRRGDLTGFFRNLKEVPRPDKRRVQRKFDQGDLSGAFLSAHLGWEPLIKDAYSASEGLGQPKQEASRIKAAKGFTGNYNYATALPKGCKFTGKSFGVHTIILTVKREATFSERFGMANPFLIAWELVPLSFVADYFLPISDVITALGFVGQRGAREGWFKAYTEEVSIFEAPPGTLKISYGGKQFTNRLPASHSYYRKTSSRSPYTVSLSHALSVNTKLPTSLMKLATLSSLAHQNILSLAKR